MLWQPMFAEVLMYRTRFCSYCIRAARLLEAKGVPFREIDVSADPETRERLLVETGSHTVPQIFINGASVGGYDDIASLDRRGALDPLLREPPARRTEEAPR